MSHRLRRSHGLYGNRTRHCGRRRNSLCCGRNRNRLRWQTRHGDSSGGGLRLRRLLSSGDGRSYDGRSICINYDGWDACGRGCRLATAGVVVCCSGSAFAGHVGDSSTGSDCTDACADACADDPGAGTEWCGASACDYWSGAAGACNWGCSSYGAFAGVKACRCRASSSCWGGKWSVTSFEDVFDSLREVR